MTPTDATRPADGPAPDSGHTETHDAREGLRGAITPETIAELRRVSDLFNEGKMAIPLGPVFHHLPVLLDAAERLAEVTAERDALAASVARVRAQVEEWEARVSFNEASLVHHPDNFWHGMATKGRECADEARRALDGSES